MFGAIVTAALQHVDEALDICVDIGVRVFKRIANTGLGCEMNDDWKMMLLEKRFGSRAIGQIEFHKGEIGMALQNLETRFFQFGVVITVDRVKAHYHATVRQQTLRNVKPDKAGSSGD